MKKSKQDKQADAANKETAANDKQTIKDEASAQVRHDKTQATGASGLTGAYQGATGQNVGDIGHTEVGTGAWLDRFRNKEGS
jgi:hypothetical protein